MLMTYIQEAHAVSSGYIPAKDEPGSDDIVEALREAVFENRRLREMPAEEVARQLVLEVTCSRNPRPCWWLTCWTRWRPRRKASRPTRAL